MTVSKALAQAMQGTAWIRRLFDGAGRLESNVGADAVCDFSSGNPLIEPPPQFQRALHGLACDPVAGMHRYMPNGGLPSTRAAVAKKVSAEQGIAIDAADVLMTWGGAGALHIALKSLLDPGDEVIILAPYYYDYRSYIETHRGVVHVVETDDRFEPDIAAIDAAIGPRTKALIINTPNNPTGVIYSAESLAQLGELLGARQRQYGRALWLLADTAYAKVTFDGHQAPPLFEHYANTVIAHSHSQDLAIAGDRLGYLAINPRAPARQALCDACTFCNRTLGYTNAPAIMQMALERAIDATVDFQPIAVARRLLVHGLRAVGYDFVEPRGAFYMFPRAPGGDDVAFTETLHRHNVLVVPGRGFGRAAHIRIAFCVHPSVVERAIPRFAAALRCA